MVTADETTSQSTKKSAPTINSASTAKLNIIILGGRSTFGYLPKPYPVDPSVKLTHTEGWYGRVRGPDGKVSWVKATDLRKWPRAG
jgi:hypothetical protein